MITCRICNEKFKVITITHLKKHNLTVEEYKNKFPNAKIICKETRLKASKTSMGRKNSKEHIEKARMNLKKRFASGELKPWTQGKTKKTDKRLRISGENISRSRKNKSFKHIGEKHNRLKIIGLKPSNDSSRNYWYVCRCDCGKVVKVYYYSLKNNRTKSCGCLFKEVVSINASRTGIERGRWGKKYKWYFIKNNKKIKCRSGWEVLYANYLIKNNIRFEYENKTFEFEGNTRYTPDFYLNDSEEYIEIKGDKKSKNSLKQIKKIEILKLSHKISILYWDDIYKICNLPYKWYGTYFLKSQKMKILSEDYFGKMIYLKNRKAEVA